jgi:hypothetical protein
MCRSMPKSGVYDFCGEACKESAMSNTPLLLEVPQGHVTYDMGMLPRFNVIYMKL